MKTEATYSNILGRFDLLLTELYFLLKLCAILHHSELKFGLMAVFHSQGDYKCTSNQYTLCVGGGAVSVLV